MEEKFPMTLEGLQRLETELKTLKMKERPAVIAAIESARELGDLSENAEYHAARDRQSFIEGRILELEDVTSRAQVIDPATIKTDKAVFGKKVKIVDDDTDKAVTYQIVGQYEADIDRGLISIASPLGKSLLGKAAGDTVEIKTPKGTKVYTILGVA
jgi:transcription elongation factor GreA